MCRYPPQICQCRIQFILSSSRHSLRRVPLEGVGISLHSLQLLSQRAQAVEQVLLAGAPLPDLRHPGRQLGRPTVGLPLLLCPETACSRSQRIGVIA